MVSNVCTSRTLAPREPDGTLLLLLVLLLGNVQKDSTEMPLTANLFLSAVFPQLHGLMENAQVAVLSRLLDLETLVNPLNNVKVDKFGTLTSCSACALKTLDGMEISALLVEVAKFGISMKAVNALLDNSSMEINVKLPIEPDVLLFPMPTGISPPIGVFVTLVLPS